MGVVPISPPDRERGFLSLEADRPAAAERSPTATTARGADADPLTGLLERVVLRDTDAFSRLYDATVHRLFAVARRIVGSHETAEEVVSDVYMQVWRDAARYDPGRGPVHTWMLLICRSRALDALRRVDRAVAHPDPHALAEAPREDTSSGDMLLEALERGARVRAAVESLAPMERQLIALAFFRDLTHSEIAIHCGMPLGTVKSRIRHALRVLHGCVEPSVGS